jgi:O-antigen ligase
MSLILLGLMWVWPFLYYRHAYPVTTFYEEWGAALMGVCAMPLLLTQGFWQAPRIPRIALLPAGFMLLVLLQLALGRIAYASHALLLMLYFLWAALLMLLGQFLRTELGLQRIATTLAGFLLAGAELSAVVGVLQHFHWATLLDTVVLVDEHLTVFGNMGQPNHFADYTSLGLASLGLFYAGRHVRAWQAALLAVPLLFVLVLSGSRSAWLYLLCFAVMAAFWRRRDKSEARLLHYSLALLLGFGLMHLVVQLPGIGGVTPVERMLESASKLAGSGMGSAGSMEQKSIRLSIWREAWLIFSQFPVLGAGLGQFAWQHFLLGPVLRNPGVTGLYNNAHNLVMQAAAETGLAGLAVLLGPLFLWVQKLREERLTVYHWWGAGLLAVLGVHSLLEYPLWYSYFLGVAALTLGMLEGYTYRFRPRVILRVSLAGVLLAGLLMLAQLGYSYHDLETLNTMRPQTQQEMNRLVGGLRTMATHPLLEPFAEVALSGMLEAGPSSAAGEHALNTRVMRYVPIDSVVYRESLYLALEGRMDEAEAQVERAIWGYPYKFNGFFEQLRDLAQKDPAHFAALLKFASGKFEEYQRAVHIE